MVHHSLDYTHTWHLENLCVLIAVVFDPWHPKYMYGYLKQWYNPKALWIRLMSSNFTLDSAYLVWAVKSQISLQPVHFWLFCVYSIFFLPITPPMWQMFQVLLVYFDHTHIWKVSGCSNHGAITFWCCGSLMILLGMEIWHVGQNAMFVFWRQ